jgi:guanyl-specific ribonuclease Sa
MTIKTETTDLKRRGRNVDAALPPPASTLFEVAHRGGIWEVTKDGRFYGHYHSQQPAFDAEAAAHAAVASGGSADILLRGERRCRETDAAFNPRR